MHKYHLVNLLNVTLGSDHSGSLEVSKVTAMHQLEVNLQALLGIELGDQHAHGCPSRVGNLSWHLMVSWKKSKRILDEIPNLNI